VQCFIQDIDMCNILINQPIADISRFESIGCQQTPLVSDMAVFNDAASIQAEFARSYGLLTVNSPAKKRALVTLMDEYSKLSSSERTDFKQWLLTKSAQIR